MTLGKLHEFFRPYCNDDVEHVPFDAVLYVKINARYCEQCFNRFFYLYHIILIWLYTWKAKEVFSKYSGLGGADIFINIFYKLTILVQKLCNIETVDLCQIKQKNNMNFGIIWLQMSCACAWGSRIPNGALIF